MTAVPRSIVPDTEDQTPPTLPSFATAHDSDLLKLLETLMLATSETSAYESALSQCLSAICSFSGWPIGHIYKLGSKGALVSTKIWHISANLGRDQATPFVSQTEITSFSPGEGIVGKVFADKKPVSIANAAKDQKFLRATSAEIAGMRGYLAFPIMVAAKCYAVMEFLSPQEAKIGEQMGRIMNVAGQQAGRILEREMHAETLANLRERFRQEITGVVEQVAAASSQLTSTASKLADLVQHTQHEGEKACAAAEQAYEDTKLLAEDTQAVRARAEAAQERTLHSKSLATSAAEDGRAASNHLTSLNHAVKDVEGAVALVRQITKATRMLALNAAIEAKRAGVHGQGFAVVADEVKALASQTDQATTNIENLVGNIAKACDTTARSVEGILGTVFEMETLAGQASETADKQFDTSVHMAQFTKEAASLCELAAKHSDSVGKSVGSAAEAAHDLNKAANLLRNQGATLNASVDAFLNSLT